MEMRVGLMSEWKRGRSPIVQITDDELRGPVTWGKAGRCFSLRLTPPTNSSQSDTLQVKSEILVKSAN